MEKMFFIVVLLVMFCYGCVRCPLYDYYEYKDLNNEVRIAKECCILREIFVCELEDGTQLQVQSFKGVE